MYKLVSAKGNLYKKKKKRRGSEKSKQKDISQKLTTNEIKPIMTIPRVSLSLSETAARACPPMMLFKIRKHCKENTFKILGRAAA